MGYPGCVAAALCRLPVRDLAPSRPLPALFSSFMNDSIRVVPSSLYSTPPSKLEGNLNRHEPLLEEISQQRIVNLLRDVHLLDQRSHSGLREARHGIS